MTVAIIDGDTVAYRCAASAEHDSEDIAFIRASRLLQDIVSITDADEIKLFLSGSANFRYEIYPEYKANRKDKPRPKHLQRTREFLVLNWGAEVTDGYEADDAIGIAATWDRSAIICSVDKDLRQLPGLHFNFVSKDFDNVSERDGWCNFYSQLILGDKADNIPGYDGKSRPKWPKFLSRYQAQLQQAQTSQEMYSVILELYNDSKTLIRNARLLYLWRKVNDLWQPPMFLEGTSEGKPATEEKSVSIVTTPEAITPSTGPTGMKLPHDGFRVLGPSTVSLSIKTPLEV